MKYELIRVVFFVVTALAACLSVAASDPAGQRLSVADRVELRQIEGLLLDAAAHERPGAAVALANLAARYRVPPQELRDLLVEAAADSDPDIARIASKALARFEFTAQASLDPLDVTDSLESRDRIELEQIERLLGDPDHHERSGVGLQLVNLAAGYRDLPSEVRSLLEQASDDPDPRVADPATAFLARHDGWQVTTLAPVMLSQEAEDDFLQALAMLQDPDPGRRWLALARLRDRPLPELEHQMRVQAIRDALSDSDPTVRNYASFALTALVTGDPDALAQVHVGRQAAPDAMALGQPAPSPETDTGDPQPGFVTPAGVFVGTPPLLDDMIGAQPPSDGVAGWAHEGSVDASGVFIGSVPTVQPREDHQQPPS